MPFTKGMSPWNKGMHGVTPLKLKKKRKRGTRTHRLPCGHMGTIVATYKELNAIAVKGNPAHQCDRCSKPYDPWKRWNRIPTVFILEME